MLGDLFLSLIKTYKRLFTLSYSWVKQNVFCVHRYTKKERVLGWHSVTEYTCEKCGRTKYR